MWFHLGYMFQALQVLFLLSLDRTRLNVAPVSGLYAKLS